VCWSVTCFSYLSALHAMADLALFTFVDALTEAEGSASRERGGSDGHAELSIEGDGRGGGVALRKVIRGGVGDIGLEDILVANSAKGIISIACCCCCCCCCCCYGMVCS
jgi:hypothetical protein